MGSLTSFNSMCKSIKDLVQAHDSRVFVETGCFRGNSLEFALGLPFEKLYSCDIDIEMIKHCENRFANKVDLYHGDSMSYLEQLLPKLENYHSVFFFLDAHLPEHDKNNGSIISNVSDDINFPLKNEILLINQFRSKKNDVIICDDLRLFEDGPFTGGCWNKRLDYNLSLDFLKHTKYNIEKFYAEEGYILLTR